MISLKMAKNLRMLDYYGYRKTATFSQPVQSRGGITYLLYQAVTTQFPNWAVKDGFFMVIYVTVMVGVI